MTIGTFQYLSASTSTPVFRQTFLYDAERLPKYLELKFKNTLDKNSEKHI